MKALHAWNLYLIFSISFSRLVTCTTKSIYKLLIAIDIILKVGTCVEFSLGLCMYSLAMEDSITWGCVHIWVYYSTWLQE